MGADVTIAIPTLNEEGYLEDCLESLAVAIQRCSTHAFEVIVIDSESEDATQEIANNHAIVDRIETVGPGILTARREGFESANGDIVVCVDADCVYHEDFLTKLLAPFEENDDVVLTYGTVLGQDGLHVDAMIRTVLQYTLPLAGAGWVSGSNRAVDRDAYFESGGFKEVEPHDSPRVMFEEQLLWPLRMKKLGKVKFVWDALSRQSSRNMDQLLLKGEKNGGTEWRFLRHYDRVKS